MTWPPAEHGLDDYMSSVWRKQGKNHCEICGKPVYWEGSSGEWEHADFSRDHHAEAVDTPFLAARRSAFDKLNKWLEEDRNMSTAERIAKAKQA